MPIYSATRAGGGGGQFTGADAATGLFIPAVRTGSSSIQPRINSIVFSTSSTIDSWALSLIDPSDGQVIELLTDTTTDLVLGGPHGFMLLPTNSDQTPWRISFVTTNMAAAGTLKIDFDETLTEGG